ncbi:MAG TPA: TRAP transporter substrate-binding protein DctP, partial [Stellaceae bacterium]|nr:TRAP transporter substrate-binding protein DctP [Stellaceae bacterium]
MNVTRRTVLSRAGAAAAATFVSPLVLRWPANAAEFAYKYGTALPEGHPMVIRSKEAAAKIKEESGGKLDITLYPSSVLGQDTAMMSQAILGGLEIYGMSLDILAQKSPSAAIFGVGFAFPDYDTAWKAMDG